MTQIQQVSTDTAVGSETIDQRVVVVIDGSANSVATVRRAVEQARRIGAVVDLVCALDARAEDDMLRRMRRYRDTYGPGQVMPRSQNLVESTARERIEQCLRRAFPDARPGVPVRIRVSQGGGEDHRTPDADVASCTETTHPISPRRAMP